MSHRHPAVAKLTDFMIGGALLIAPVTAAHADDATPPDRPTHTVSTTMGVGQGVESNVFYSESNPQSDFFTLSEAAIHIRVRTTPDGIFFADFLGSHQHFWEFHKSDRAQSDLALDYRHRIRSALWLGLADIFSFSDRKLFDTEGNALPRDKFGSVQERVRLYSILEPVERLSLEGDVSYGLIDIEETEDRPPFNFPSLDFTELSAGLSARTSWTRATSLRVKYDYSVVWYDELQAFNGTTSFDGLADLNTPRLRLRRQQVSIEFKYKKPSRLALQIENKARLNEDRFEGDLTYYQMDTRGKATLTLWGNTTARVELQFTHRKYTERRNQLGSGETLREDFWVGDAEIDRDLTSWLQGYVRYQWIHKTSNASLNEFDDHNGLVGLRLILGP